MSNTDITRNSRFQRIIAEAAEYRILEQIYRADPEVGPQTAALFRECFRAARDDPAELRRLAASEDD
jgi:hypothetical protein